MNAFIMHFEVKKCKQASTFLPSVFVPKGLKTNVGNFCHFQRLNALRRSLFSGKLPFPVSK